MTPFHYQAQHLFCEDVSLSEIAAQVGTPVYVYSQATLEERATAYVSPLTAPSLTCFAVKANPNPSLLRLLGQWGLGADVTSGGELFLAQQAGIPAPKMIFSGVGKSRSEIETAVQAGIRAIHVESEMELEVIAAVASQHQRVTAVGVRVNPNIVADTHPYISTGQKAHKFGVDKERAMAMLAFAAAHPWLQPVGIAAHIGSQITDLQPFVESARFLVAMAQELTETGIRLTYLDVGGGLGVDYTDGASNDTALIREWVTAVSQPVHVAGYEVVMEPGRSIVGPVGALLTQVIYTKPQGEKQFVIVDSGMNDLIRPTLYHAYHPILPVSQPSPDTVTSPVEMVGPICETGDWLAQERPFPPTAPGDLLAILMSGAYGFAMSSNYNGRPKPAEVLVHGNQFHLIRQRQTLAHLLDGC